MCNDGTLSLLVRQVVPLARQHLRLLDVAAHPGAYGILGASMGGLMALYAGLRLPDLFGHVIALSGSFTLPFGMDEPLIVDLVQHLPVGSAQVWLAVGTYEKLWRANLQMSELLRDHGYAAVYQEYHGGHNYTCWSDALWQGLVAHFGQE
jgi:enterochelin esterase family protein